MRVTDTAKWKFGGLDLLGGDVTSELTAIGDGAGAVNTTYEMYETIRDYTRCTPRHTHLA